MFILFLAAFFPWAVFLINDDPGEAVLALVIQATVIGWPFATIWAWRAHYSKKNKAK